MLVRSGRGAIRGVKIRLALEPLFGWVAPLMLAVAISASQARGASDSAVGVAWWTLMGAALYMTLALLSVSVRKMESTLRVRRLSGWVRVVELSDIRCVRTRPTMTPGTGFAYFSQLVLELKSGRIVRLFATTGARQIEVSSLLEDLARFEFIRTDVDISDFPRRVSDERA